MMQVGYRIVFVTCRSINIQQNSTGLACLFVGIHFRYTLTCIALPESDCVISARVISCDSAAISFPLEPDGGTVLEICSICLCI